MLGNRGKTQREMIWETSIQAIPRQLCSVFYIVNFAGIWCLQMLSPLLFRGPHDKLSCLDSLSSVPSKCTLIHRYERPVQLAIHCLQCDQAMSLLVVIPPMKTTSQTQTLLQNKFAELVDVVLHSATGSCPGEDPHFPAATSLPVPLSGAPAPTCAALPLTASQGQELDPAVLVVQRLAVDVDLRVALAPRRMRMKEKIASKPPEVTPGLWALETRVLWKNSRSPVRLLQLVPDAQHLTRG